MKKTFLAVIIAICCEVASAQTGAYHGTCTQGATATTVQGMQSSNKHLSAASACLVRVYASGTTNLVTLYGDAVGTPLSNPFTAPANGLYLFYATLGVHLDVTVSGAGLVTTTTADVVPAVASSSGSGISAVTGDVQAAGTGSVNSRVLGVNGAAVPTAAQLTATNSQGQVVAATPANVANLLSTLPNCSSVNPNTAYSPGAGQCVSAGGTPGGTFKQLQFNNNGVFGGSQAVVDAPGNIVTPAAITSQAVNGVSNVQSYGGVTQALNAGVTTATIPPGSTVSDLWTSDLNNHPEFASPITSFLYQNKGIQAQTSYDLLAPTYLGGSAGANVQSYYTNCFHKTPFGYNADGTMNGYGPGGGSGCVGINDRHWERGWNVGTTGGGFGGWEVMQAFNVSEESHTSGIGQAMSATMSKYGDGDQGSLYLYGNNTGGSPDGSGEGKVGLSVQPFETGAEFSATVTGFTATSVSTTGCHTSGPNGADICNIASDTHPIINLTTPVATVHATAISRPDSGNGPGLVTVAEAVTPSPVQCTTSSTFTSPGLNYFNTAAGEAGSTGSVTIACPSGTQIDTTKVLVFGCDEGTEYTHATISQSGNSYTVTGNFQRDHAVGCRVFQGGVAGFLDFVADRHIGSSFNSPGTLLRDAFEIVGSTDAHHLMYRLLYLGGQQPLPPSNYNLGITSTFSTTSRAANVVTACYGNANLAEIMPVVNRSVTVTGSSDSSFNGTVTPIGYDQKNNCLAWNQTGANATGITGLTIAIGGTNDDTGKAVVWPGAYVTGVQQTAQLFNGTFNVRQNDVVWANGQTVEQVHGMGTLMNTITTGGAYNTLPAPSAPGTVLALSQTGWGVSNGFANIRCTNGNNNIGMYSGYGGGLVAPTCMAVNGLFSTMIGTAAPTTALIAVGQPISPTNGQGGPAPWTPYNSVYNVIQANTHGGGDDQGVYSITLDAYNNTVLTRITGLDPANPNLNENKTLFTAMDTEYSKPITAPAATFRNSVTPLFDNYATLGTSTQRWLSLNSVGVFANQIQRNGIDVCDSAGNNCPPAGAPATNPAGGQRNYAPIDSPNFTGNGYIAGNFQIGNVVVANNSMVLSPGSNSNTIEINPYTVGIAPFTDQVGHLGFSNRRWYEVQASNVYSYGQLRRNGVDVCTSDGTNCPTGNSGTVTSVALTMPTALYASSVSGSPVTSSGTLSPALANQSPSAVFAGPIKTAGTQANQPPAFRALVSSDLAGTGVLPAEIVQAGGSNITVTPLDRQVVTIMLSSSGSTSVAIQAGAAAASFALNICQSDGGTGTVTVTGVHGLMNLSSVAQQACSTQSFVYSANQGGWYATSTGVVNQ